jgi:hypothetical protein
MHPQFPPSIVLHLLAAASLARSLKSPEEVHISKLLHLIDIRRLSYFLVIKEDPRRLALAGDGLSDEGYVVSVSALAPSIHGQSNLEEARNGREGT